MALLIIAWDTSYKAKHVLETPPWPMGELISLFGSFFFFFFFFILSFRCKALAGIGV